MKKIVIVAGDTSGDLYGGVLAKTIKEKYGQAQIYSFGGPSLAKYSQQKVNLLSHSVCGLIEVISSLRKIIKDFKKTLNEIEKIKPDLIILIDFPDFNLRLAKKINKKYPVFYYVSPQLWAWRKGRIKQIRKFIDKMIVIFKFEKDFYEKKGVEALYFGHPLLEIIKPPENETKNVISFMPGSRKNEIKKHLPLMLEAKTIIKNKLPGYAFQVIKPKSLKNELYPSLPKDINLVDHSYNSLAESKFIIASSGTATVEIAILGIPYLIIYKLNNLSWQLLKRLVKTEFIGMVNILAKRKIVNELIQNQATPEKIAEEICTYLTNQTNYNRLKTDLEKIKAILGPYGATEKLASYIATYLNLI